LSIISGRKTAFDITSADVALLDLDPDPEEEEPAYPSTGEILESAENIIFWSIMRRAPIATKEKQS
jgi:hypothetical protein